MASSSSSFAASPPSTNTTITPYWKPPLETLISTLMTSSSSSSAASPPSTNTTITPSSEPPPKPLPTPDTTTEAKEVSGGASPRVTKRTAAALLQKRVPPMGQSTTGFTLLGPNCIMGLTPLGPSYTTGFTLLSLIATTGFTLLGSATKARKERNFPEITYPDPASPPKDNGGEVSA